MDDGADFTTKCGYTMDDLAREGRELFHHLIQRDLDTWEEIPNDVKEHWLDCIEILVNFCEMQIETSWNDVASRIYSAYHGGAPDDVPLILRLIWQAVCRHVVNLITALDQEDLQNLKEAKEFWAEWVLERSKKDGGNGNSDDGHKVGATATVNDED